MTLVVVLLGTDHHPFHRLVQWADEWLLCHHPVRVVVQHGHTPAPSVAEAVEILPPDQLQELVHSADVVISHGGPGTMMMARSNGRLPLLVPRDPEKGEHVDDHQQRFSCWVASKRLARVVANTDDLGRAVEDLLARPVLIEADPTPLEAPARLAKLIETKRRKPQFVQEPERSG